MTATRPGGFLPSELQVLLVRVCETAGLDPRGAQLLRGQTNAVIRLTAQPVLVKIARKGTPVAEVRRTVEFVEWLMDMGFPTGPLHRIPEQPLVVDGQAVTFWTYLPQPDQAVSAEALAKPLNALHNAPAPPVSLHRLDAISAIRSSLAHATALPAAAMDILSAEADRLEAALADVIYELPEGVLHGDPQHRNALHTESGVVLCDWDSVVTGPAEWDLVTVEVHCRRFGYGESHYRRFADAYGWDVTRWDGYRVLRDIRELRMIATNARKAAYAPRTLPEVLRRVAALESGDLYRRWNLL
ncbi:phosphotransferase [Streptomyces sp. NPDC046805]|uniref:phosphotransferase family protein n=1 Tax=Streptomyces sp. NPDC046805 TaxID=3155134 RepID=UPI0033C24DEA